MKIYLLFISLWSFSLLLQAQTRGMDYYMDHAQQNSPLIHQANNDQEIISLDMQQVRNVLSKPEVFLEANIMFAPIVSHDAGKTRFEFVSDGATDYYGYDLAVSDGGQYQAGIGIRKPLLASSILQSYNEKAGISKEIAENNKELSIHEISQLVGYQYILCLKAKVQSENNRQLLDEMDEQLILMKKLVDLAVYKQTDWMLMQIERSNYLEAYKISQDDYRKNIYDLNLICGINDTAMADIEEREFEIQTARVNSSKFSNSFRLDSLSLLSEQNIFEQKYKPTLYWYANAGLNATYIPTPNRLGFSTGLGFSWTIFDGHQGDIQRQITNIKLNSNEFNRMDFARKAEINQNKIIREIQYIVEREALANDYLSKYDTLIEAYLLELPMGDISIMDLKNLSRERAVKHQQILDLKMERFLLINSYNYWNY